AEIQRRAHRFNQGTGCPDAKTILTPYLRTSARCTANFVMPPKGRSRNRMMRDKRSPKSESSPGRTRATFLTRTAQLVAGLGLASIPEYAEAQSAPNAPVPSGAKGKPPYNIVFIIVDQRVEKLLAGADYSLPAMNALAARGVTF